MITAPTRRLVLFAILFGLLTAVLSSRHGAHAQNLNSIIMEEGLEAEEIGDYLWIIKTADPPYVKIGEPVQFTIVVINTSSQFDMVNVVVSDPQVNECYRELGEIKFNEPENYECRYENVQTAFTNNAIVTGETDKGKPDEASDTADVEVLELTAIIEPEPVAVPFSGDQVKFTVTVTNKSSVKVQLKSLISSQLGDLADPQNGNLDPNTCTNAIGRQLAEDDGTYGCTFTTDVSGPADYYPFDVTATASVKNAPAFTVSGTGDTEVQIFETITTSLTTKKQIYATGSLITLKATIDNLSKTSSVNILTMEDAVLGDVTLTPHGSCSLPQTLQPGGSYPCYYQQTVTATAGSNQPFTLNVTAETNETPPLAIQDQASVTVTGVKPLSFLPITPFIPRPTTCIAALNIETNRSYSFHRDIEDAYYRFELTKTSDIKLEIDNFKSTDGSVLLFTFNGEECNPDFYVKIDDDGTNNEYRELIGNNNPPGTYFARVSSGKDLSKTDTYSLILKTE